MAEALTFPSTTSGLGIPLLFTGQAQKEFFLNQALATLDAVAVGAVEDVQSEAPATAEEGACYLVDIGATGEWHLHDNELAVRIGEGWHFIAPRPGMSVYDRAQQRRMVYNSGWASAVAPSEPSGGSVIDTEARQVLGELLTALQDAGILAAP